MLLNALKEKLIEELRNLCKNLLHYCKVDTQFQIIALN